MAAVIVPALSRVTSIVIVAVPPAPSSPGSTGVVSFVPSMATVKTNLVGNCVGVFGELLLPQAALVSARIK